MKFILGVKKNMTQVFDDKGNVVPVTVLEAGPVIITQIKTEKVDGYNSVQVGFGVKKEKNISFKDQYRILVPSREPGDKSYIQFINSLDLGVAMVGNKELKPVGKDLGFSNI